MPALFSGFSGETASTGLSVLLILAKATIVLLAALGVTRALERGSAVSRHLVWFVALGAVLLIPAVASWSKSFACLERNSRLARSGRVRDIMPPSCRPGSAVDGLEVR